MSHSSRTRRCRGTVQKAKSGQTNLERCQGLLLHPLGNTKDGKEKVFLLGRDGVQYFPVFRSRESLMAFYEKMNRAGNLILEGDVRSVAETIRSIELMKDVAIVVEPLSENPVEIMPGL